MVLKYCAQSLAHKPLSNLVEAHLFLDQGKKGIREERGTWGHTLYGVAEGALN